jgi:hypothetical protein
MRVMSSLATKLLVLFVSGLLTLPPGWCCVPPASPAEEQPQLAESSCCCCCSQTADVPTSDEHPRPLPPLKGRCCQWDSTAPPAPKVLTADLAPAPQHTLLDLSLTALAPPIGFEASESAVSPPLQILLCVWRC